MSLKPAYTGICTFGRAPHVPLASDPQAEVMVLGVPYDEGVGFRPGTRFGPRSIREYSLRFPYFGPDGGQQGYWDIESRTWRLASLKLVDCGDVDLIPMDPLQTHLAIEGAVQKIIELGALPVLLGGDHSITYPAVRAFAGNGPLTLVQLDAHLDRRQAKGAAIYGHGSPVWRISELDFIQDIISFGLRGLRAPEADYIAAEKRGERLVPRHMIRSQSLEKILAELPGMERIYVTIDIDVLDPSIAPGTGTPEADGLSYHEVRRILQALADSGQIVGFDLVEVNPQLDYSGLTSLTAAQLIVEFLGDIYG